MQIEQKPIDSCKEPSHPNAFRTRTHLDVTALYKSKEHLLAVYVLLSMEYRLDIPEIEMEICGDQVI